MKRRNGVGRLFRYLKGFGKTLSRLEKLDGMFLGFVSSALMADGGIGVLKRPSSKTQS